MSGFTVFFPFSSSPNSNGEMLVLAHVVLPPCLRFRLRQVGALRVTLQLGPYLSPSTPGDLGASATVGGKTCLGRLLPFSPPV